jgi:titin
VISGNNGSGVVITDVGTNGNLVEGNYIGTDVTGKVAIGNAINGVWITNGASSNTVGGASGARNVISGSVNGVGVQIDGGSVGYADNNVVSGDYIGTDVTGNKGLGNYDGVYVDTASYNTISGCLISANTNDGVQFFSHPGVNAYANNNTVSDCVIGTSASGTALLGNGNAGVEIDYGFNNTIDFNTIANNQYGILLYGTVQPNTTAPNTFRNNAKGNVVTQGLVF